MKKETTTPPPIFKPHEFTNGDAKEVLIVKCTDASRRAYEGFEYPATIGAIVEAPDWRADNKCGGGLHGWPWGLGIGDGKEPDYHGVWYVIGVKPEDIVGELEGGAKCKFRAGVVRYVGPWAGALSLTLQGRMAYTVQASSGSASNSGYSGSASNSGDSGSASTSAKGSAAICTGLYSRARAAEFGCIALAWWNEAEKRVEMRCAITGVGQQLKADTWYELNDDAGEFKEVA